MPHLYPIIRRKRVPLTVRHAAPINVPIAPVPSEPVAVTEPTPSIPEAPAPAAKAPAPTAPFSVKTVLSGSRKKTPCTGHATPGANGN